MSVALPRVASRPVVVAVLAVGLWLGAAGRVQADPLNPLDFPSLGAFPTAPGDYTINTGGTPTLTGPGGTTLTGVVSRGIAVFDFDAINVTSGQTFFGTGSFPLALLSRTNATFAGTIDGSGSGSPWRPWRRRRWLRPWRWWPWRKPVLIVMPPIIAISFTSGGGGGGFGGSGGSGGVGGPFDRPPGGLGGAPYGDLARQLQGGSGGGDSSDGPGAGGGGAIEIGAVGPLTISGSILARGGGSLFSGNFGGGGGSGGGILLHANSVLLTGSLSAAGGDGIEGFGPTGGPGSTFVAPGGGGGGGRVTILSGPGGFVAERGHHRRVRRRQRPRRTARRGRRHRHRLRPRAGEPGAPGHRRPRPAQPRVDAPAGGSRLRVRGPPTPPRPVASGRAPPRSVAAVGGRPGRSSPWPASVRSGRSPGSVRIGCPERTWERPRRRPGRAVGCREGLKAFRGGGGLLGRPWRPSRGGWGGAARGGRRRPRRRGLPRTLTPHLSAGGRRRAEAR